MNIKTFAALLLIFSFQAAFAGPGNIAPQAKVSVSTQLNDQFSAAKAIDGIIGVDGMGEWACEGTKTPWGYIRHPWLQLDWDSAVTINKVVVYDRASAEEHVAGAKLLFSDGSVVWINQIPNDGSGRAISFAAKKVTWVRFLVSDATGKDLGLSEIEVYTAPEASADYISLVDPYIETNRGRYFFFVTGSLPFGMIGSAPHTRNINQFGGGYNYNEKEILGFGQIHNWMMSGIEIMPGTEKDDPAAGESGWKSAFSHEDEIVQPGYHRLLLQKNKIWVEQTATERVSFYRFRYTEDANARIIINLSGHLGNSTMKNADVKKIGQHELQGSFSSADRFWGGPKDVKVFFVIRFDKPFDMLDGWKANNQQVDIDSISGDSVCLTANYALKKGDLLNMKIGISYTTIENARKNLDAECTTWNFDDVRSSAQRIWNEWLGKIDVQGGSTDQRVKFYTDLWHVLLGRHKITDINGEYPDRTTGVRDGTFTDAVFKIKRVPLTENGNPRFHMYNSDAWWLTHWNLNVLWGLAWPEVLDEMSASMIEYANNGGLLPRGPSGGGYSYIMTSSPASNLIGSAFMKGLLTKADHQHAYATIRRNHLPGGMLGDAEDIKFYTKNGWWPDNVGITIEAAYQDWGIAQMAAKLGKKKDYSFFLKRSQGWKHNFDPEQKLLFPKDRNGKFMHKDPLSGQGWVEANAWQGTWGLSHALPELIKLMGGADTFTHKLNYTFEMSRADDFVFGYSDGYVSYANQPGCSNAHVFSYAGKPWLTQYWVRRVQQQAYGGVSPDLGYGGHDEDQGQMGGVSALMAIGLFNITGNQAQTPVYEITSPIFDQITIHLDKRYYSGERFVIRTHNNGPTKDYIQRARLNGNEHTNFWFTHEVFSKGGELDIWLGEQPNTIWGVDALPPVN